MQKPLFEDMFETYKNELHILSATTARTLSIVYRASWAYKGCIDYEPSDPYQKALETELDKHIENLIENEAKLHKYFLKTVNKIKNRKRPEANAAYEIQKAKLELEEFERQIEIENEAKLHEYFLKTVNEIKNRKRPE